MVSIVVPAYNCADTIIRCLQSLKVQTYDDYEVIVVDDGSTDNTLSVVKTFEFSKLRVFSKENGGPGSARNYGLASCSPDSRYVMFVDSDDTVDASYVSSMLAQANEDTLVICGINDWYEDRMPASPAGPQPSGVTVYDDIWNNTAFLKLLRNGIINSSCNKCYSLNTIRNGHIEFGSSYPEDTRFNISYLEHCRRVAVLDARLYNYIHRAGSVTGGAFESLYTGYIDIQQQLCKKVSEENQHHIYEFVYPQYLGNTMNYLRSGDFKTPRRYSRMKPVRDAIAAHKPVCAGDALTRLLYRMGCLRLLKRIVC